MPAMYNGTDRLARTLAIRSRDYRDWPLHLNQDMNTYCLLPLAGYTQAICLQSQDAPLE